LRRYRDGKVFECKKNEYEEYHNASESDSYFLDVPEPTDEWVTHNQ